MRFQYTKQWRRINVSRYIPNRSNNTLLDCCLHSNRRIHALLQEKLSICTMGNRHLNRLINLCHRYRRWIHTPATANREGNKMNPMALRRLEQIEELKSNNHKKRIATLFITLSAFTYVVDQYYNVSYTAIFFGGDQTAWLFGFMLSVGSIFLWNEKREYVEQHNKTNYGLWLAIICLTTFNGYTLLDTQIQKSIETINNKSINTPEITDIKASLKTAQARQAELNKILAQKDDKLEALRRANRQALNNINSDSQESLKKCRSKKCRARVNRIRTNNKTSENKSFRRQLDSLLKDKESTQQAIKEEQNIIASLQVNLQKLRADFKNEKQKQKQFVLSDIKNIAMVLIVIFFDSFSLFIFFKNISRRNALISKINRSNRQQIADKSSQIDDTDLYKTPADYKEIIEKKVMLGTYRHLGQKTLSNDTNGIVSQNLSKKWHEEWEAKGWIIIPRKENGHWNGQPYYPGDINQHQEVYVTNYGELRAVQ